MTFSIFSFLSNPESILKIFWVSSCSMFLCLGPVWIFQIFRVFRIFRVFGFDLIPKSSFLRQFKMNTCPNRTLIGAKNGQFLYFLSSWDFFVSDFQIFKVSFPNFQTSGSFFTNGKYFFLSKASNLAPGDDPLLTSK